VAVDVPGKKFMHPASDRGHDGLKDWLESDGHFDQLAIEDGNVLFTIRFWGKVVFQILPWKGCQL